MNPLNSFSLITFCSILLLVGCATTGDQKPSDKRLPTTAVEVFKDGAKPLKAYKEIGLLKDDGKAIEQEEIEAKMIKQAKKLGGNAILFEKPIVSGAEGSGFWGGAEES